MSLKELERLEAQLSELGKSAQAAKRGHDANTEAGREAIAKEFANIINAKGAVKARSWSTKKDDIKAHVFGTKVEVAVRRSGEGVVWEQTYGVGIFGIGPYILSPYHHEGAQRVTKAAQRLVNRGIKEARR